MFKLVGVTASLMLGAMSPNLLGCDDAQVEPHIAIQRAALISTKYAGIVTEDEIRLDLPLADLPGHATRSIRRAVIQIVEPRSGATVETFEHLFARGEIDDALSITLPRSFDQITVRADILLVDQVGGESRVSYELPVGLAATLSAESVPAHERTNADSSVLDSDKKEDGK